MRDIDLFPAQIVQAARTLADLRCRLDDVSTDREDVGLLLQELSWLQGELRKRRRKAQRERDSERPAPTYQCYMCKHSGPRENLPNPRLCPSCFAINEEKRNRTADCRGQVALLTGGRVKIGYEVGLRLLRAGAEVIVTSRFPRDAERRYTREPDADQWLHRLHLLPLDLRCLPLVERFAASLRERWSRLDIFIHNAAQTVRRPPAFYRHLVEGERGEHPSTALSLPGIPEAWPAILSQVALLPGDEVVNEEHFPPGLLDANGQQIDRRERNSWHWHLGDVPTVELIEAHTVNCLAPCVLLRELLPLFRAGPPRDRFAVMVSASEGRFSIRKPPRHPHTNMAKAALNMMVRTSAAALVRERIFLTAVDPGWVSLEFAEATAREKRENGEEPPLTPGDSAARILDPVFMALNGAEPLQGVLLKDYQPVPW